MCARYHAKCFPHTISGIPHQLLYVRIIIIPILQTRKLTLSNVGPCSKTQNVCDLSQNSPFSLIYHLFRIKGLHSKHWWGRVLLKEPIIDLPRHWKCPREPLSSLQTLILFRQQYVTLVDLVGVTEWWQFQSIKLVIGGCHLTLFWPKRYQKSLLDFQKRFFFPPWQIRHEKEKGLLRQLLLLAEHCQMCEDSMVGAWAAVLWARVKGGGIAHTLMVSEWKRKIFRIWSHCFASKPTCDLLLLEFL